MTKSTKKKKKKKEQTKPNMPEPNISVRVAVDKDGIVVLDMVEEFHKTIDESIAPGFEESDIIKTVAKAIISKEHDVLLAFNGSEKPVGMCVMMSYPSNFSSKTIIAEEIALLVDPEHKDKNVGEKLLDASIKWAKEHGAHLIRMVAMKGSQELAKKYVNSGFKLQESVYAKRL